MRWFSNREEYTAPPAKASARETAPVARVAALPFAAGSSTIAL
jgi:hypothetical protein